MGKLYMLLRVTQVFLSGSVVKNPHANVGDAGSISGLGRYPGEENSK